jgi:hypothetical protein
MMRDHWALILVCAVMAIVFAAILLFVPGIP